MNYAVEKIFKNLVLSRRSFLKYTGIAGGLYLLREGIFDPLTVLAQQRPRVVSIRNVNASDFDYQTGLFWEYVNQEVVNDMVARGVMTLTGKTNTVDAWKALIPYTAGEIVLIKFNFNNSGCDTAGTIIDPIPETANAIIAGLKSIGVPEDKIYITDPSRRVSARFRNGISIYYPNIQYYSQYNCSGAGPYYHTTEFIDPSSSAVSLATYPAGEKILPSEVFVEADHLINVPIFKSHGTYITLALKNHYGSVLYEHYDRSTMHAFFNQGGCTDPCLNTTNILADINNNPHIKNKTRLILGDGIFGNAHTYGMDTEPWNIFDNKDPNMLFFSTDPIAISSVMTDYIVAERGKQDHQQLHAGEYIGLGVHDHWDSFESKRYSKIDYIPIDVQRFDIDRKVKEFKEGSATEQEVKELIEEYMGKQ